jgi:hypothetical protein
MSGGGCDTIRGDGARDELGRRQRLFSGKGDGKAIYRKKR